MPVYALYYKRKEGTCQMKNSLDYEINQDYRCGYNAGFADGLSEAWISVAEGTPDPGDAVYVFAPTPNGNIKDVAEYKGGVFKGKSWNLQNTTVTHWMPLPADPEETEGGGDA